VDFPTQGPIQAECQKETTGGCSEDAFLLVLNPAGSGLWFSTYLGGTGLDEGRGLALNGKGSAYLGGATTSSNFPSAKAMTIPGGTPLRQARPFGQTEVAAETLPTSRDGSTSAARPGGFIAMLSGMGDPQQACTGTESISWVGGVDLNWSTAGNWNTDKVPVATDTVCINTTFATTTITIGSLAAANQTITSLISNANINFASGPLTVTSGANFVNALAVAGAGVLTLNGTSGSEVGTTLTLSGGGILAGTDTVTVTGMFTWGGYLCTTQTAGGCTSPTGTQGVLNANGGITSGAAFYGYLYGRTLNNTGTATMGTPYPTFLAFGAVLNNSGTWNITADADSVNIAGGAGTFNNSGLFEKTTTTGTSTVTPVFINTGSVQVNTGTLNFSAVGNSSAPWSVATGATLGLSAGSGTAALSGNITGAGTGAANFNGGTITLTGTYNVPGGTNGLGGTTNFNGTTTNVGPVTATGTLNFTTPLAANPGAVSISGGSGVVNFSTGNSVTAPTLTLSSQGALEGTDTVTITGLFSWLGGYLCTTAACTAPTGAQGVLNANGGITDSGANYYRFLDGRTLNNAGTATMNSPSYFMYLGYGSVINNQSSATWNIAADVDYLNTTNFGGTFNNAGLFEKTATTGTSLVAPLFNNTGSVQANSGTLNFYAVGNSSTSWSVATGATLGLSAVEKFSSALTYALGTHGPSPAGFGPT